jgi:hypothetical protein
VCDLLPFGPHPLNSLRRIVGNNPNPFAPVFSPDVTSSDHKRLRGVTENFQRLQDCVRTTGLESRNVLNEKKTGSKLTGNSQGFDPEGAAGIGEAEPFAGEACALAWESSGNNVRESPSVGELIAADALAVAEGFVTARTPDFAGIVVTFDWLAVTGPPAELANISKVSDFGELLFEDARRIGINLTERNRFDARPARGQREHAHAREQIQMTKVNGLHTVWKTNQKESNDR